MTAAPAVTSWWVAPAVLSALQRDARAAAPAEACGLLLGRVLGSGVEVLDARGARNLDPRAGRFRVHPVDQLAAERAASAAGLELLGAWHSHPGGDVRPSRADLAGSPYPLLAVLADAAAASGGDDRLGGWWLGGDDAGRAGDLPDAVSPLRVENRPPRAEGRDRTNAPRAIP